MLDKMTKAGPRIHAWLSKVKSRIKYLLLPNVLFEELGFTYLGPVSGHDIQSLTEALNLAKKVPNPVLLHVLTVKGKGYGPAEKEPSRFHGIGKFDPIPAGVPARLKRTTRPSQERRCEHQAGEGPCSHNRCHERGYRHGALQRGVPGKIL